MAHLLTIYTEAHLKETNHHFTQQDLNKDNMKITIDINGVPTEINLTEDQLKQANVVEPIPFNWKYIKSWEDVLKYKPNLELPFPNATDKWHIRMNNYFILVNAIELVNEGWIPDWSDDNYKYYAYLYWDTSKNGFSSGVLSFLRYCRVGSALCSSTREKAEHILKHFEDQYKLYLV